MLPEHIEFLQKHYDLGHFVLSGRKTPRTGGVIRATVSGRQTLNDILQQDPFYRENIAKYEVIEMTPTKANEALVSLLW